MNQNQGSTLTKSRASRPVTTHEAPKTAKPAATLERTHENPHPARRREGRDSKGNGRAGGKAAGADRAVPKAQVSGSQALGARVSRRAADRLRSGHLWVYASDIESIELPASDPPALVPVADSRGLLLEIGRAHV